MMFLETEKTSKIGMYELLSADIINNIWLYLCEWSDYGYALNEYQKNYRLVYIYIREVENGSIEQFFYNYNELIEPTIEF